MPAEPFEMEELSDEALLPALQPSVVDPLLRRATRAARVAAGFFAGQGAVQAVGALAGIYLVRRLSVEAYAQFGLATAFQNVFTALMDFGFASTIIPLVGDRRDDRVLVGKYVRAAKHLRDIAFYVLAPVAAVCFLTVVHRHHWSWMVQLGLLASVLLTLYASGSVSYFSAPLFLHGRLKSYYVPQVVFGTCRLMAYSVLSLLGKLNAWVAAALSALNIAANGVLFRRNSEVYLDWPKENDRAINAEVVRYILPAVPAILFAAFQSQISLLLISAFGKTNAIAQVTALGRLTQFFLILTTFNTVVVEPYVARVERHRLAGTYAGLIALACVACAPIVVAAFRWPIVFLWILGPKYSNLAGVLGWLITSACLNYVASLIWIMNRARKWVFWSGTVLEIALLLIVQVAFVVHVGMQTARNAVVLALCSSFCYLIAHGYGAIYGFARGPRLGPTTPTAIGA